MATPHQTDHHHHHPPLEPTRSNNRSIDSMILNSPSSLHRLQTLTRRQRTPLSNRPSTDPSTTGTRVDSLDLTATSPDTLSAGIGGGVLSSASSILYLSDVGSSASPASPDSALPTKTDRSTTPFGSTSTSTAASIALFLHMPRLHRFLTLTHFTSRLALLVLPLLWIAVAIAWIVYFRKRTHFLERKELLAAEERLRESLSFTEITEPEEEPPTDPLVDIHLDPSIEHRIAAWLTVLSVGVTIVFAAIFVIKSHWAYSFEFIPTEDDEDFFEGQEGREFETTTSVSGVPEMANLEPGPTRLSSVSGGEVAAAVSTSAAAKVIIIAPPTDDDVLVNLDDKVEIGEASDEAVPALPEVPATIESPITVNVISDSEIKGTIV